MWFFKSNIQSILNEWASDIWEGHLLQLHPLLFALNFEWLALAIGQTDEEWERQRRGAWITINTNPLYRLGGILIWSGWWWWAGNQISFVGVDSSSKQTNSFGDWDLRPWTTMCVEKLHRERKDREMLSGAISFFLSFFFFSLTTTFELVMMVSQKMLMAAVVEAGAWGSQSRLHHQGLVSWKNRETAARESHPKYTPTVTMMSM